jgi:hypothetical protein
MAKSCGLPRAVSFQRAFGQQFKLSLSRRRNAPLLPFSDGTLGERLTLKGGQCLAN